MKQHVDVSARDAESLRKVFACALFEETQHDHLLRAAQTLHASTETHVLFGSREEVSGRRGLGPAPSIGSWGRAT